MEKKEDSLINCCSRVEAPRKTVEFTPQEQAALEILLKSEKRKDSVTFEAKKKEKPGITLVVQDINSGKKYELDVEILSSKEISQREREKEIGIIIRDNIDFLLENLKSKKELEEKERRRIYMHMLGEMILRIKEILPEIENSTERKNYQEILTLLENKEDDEIEEDKKL